ncbi:PA2169 family four-helix-bundle protein [Nocardioides sp.]|uniref:PA2169 family four-helix-bundle protein n=1 Tax=Nocardioides sp. TaxID=35761 RepID=UPI003567AB9A
MSNDEQCTQELVRTLEDGKIGYAAGAEHLAHHGHEELAELFERYSRQREAFVTQLRGVAGDHDEEIDQSGTRVAAVHRGWMALKDLVSGSSPDSVLSSAIQGEDHAIEIYLESLGQELSERLRTLADLQLDEIRLARAELARRMTHSDPSH